MSRPETSSLLRIALWALLCALLTATAQAARDGGGAGSGGSYSNGGSGSVSGPSSSNGGRSSGSTPPPPQPPPPPSRPPPPPSSNGGGGGSGSSPAPASTALPRGPPSGWVRGRTTYYGGPDLLAKTYDPHRGEGSFGILAFGSCGFTNSDGTLPFPQDAVAAPADANPDFAGSCGRCYQFKCVNGVVAASNSTPVKIVNGFYDGDTMRPYLPALNPNISDTKGRAWPGNPGESKGLQMVQCWDENKTITVRIIDSCPCIQVLPDGAPGVKKGGEVRRQEWCCGSQNHFDLSYWAFEKLAHPVYGVMSVDYRPVDCDTNQPLPPPPAPGYVSRVLYDDGIKPGWSWFAYDRPYAKLVQSGAGVGGSAATCVQLSEGGGLEFTCRACGGPGYQPFAGANAISFWIRSNSNSSDPQFSSTPSGSVPAVKFFVQQDGSYSKGKKEFCGNEAYLGGWKPAETRGEWFKLVIPMSYFKCQGLVPQERLNRIEFQNTNQRDAYFCLDQIEIA